MLSKGINSGRRLKGVYHTCEAHYLAIASGPRLWNVLNEKNQRTTTQSCPKFMSLSERSHALSGIRSDKSLKKRNRSSNLLLGKESKDTDLGQSAVVDLGNASSGLGFVALAAGEAEGVEKVEGDRVGDLIRVRELGEGTRCSSLHVVSSVGLREVLQESNEEDDLPLGGIGKGVPLLWGGSGSIREWGAVEGHGPREVDSVGLHDISDEGGHGNTSVLDLSMTQEADGGLGSLSPDGSGSQLKRIVVLRIGGSEQVSIYHFKESTAD
jgi:hypothetical protein